MSDQPPTSPHWETIDADPAFRSLLRRKVRFIILSTLFFTIYYFSLPVMVGWFPELMKTAVLGKVNLAYLFALSQFVMAWTLAWIYTRKAAGWDLEAAALLRCR